MAGQPKGKRDENLRLVIDTINEFGVVKARRLVRQQLGITDRCWRAYLADVYAEFKSAMAAKRDENAAAMVARLNALYAEAETKERVHILRELAKIYGIYSAVKIETSGTAEIQLKTMLAGIIASPDAAAAELGNIQEAIGDRPPAV